jgi:hypothetical protein
MVGKVGKVGEVGVDTYKKLFIPKIHICIYLKTKTIEQPTLSYSL